MDEEFQVTARIQRGTETVHTPLQQLPGRAPVIRERLPVGTHMRADLDGANFDVELIGQELQPLLDQSIAEWAWKVRPRTAGQQSLRLTVYVELAGEPLSNRVFDRTIDVQVVHESGWSRLVGWSLWEQVVAGLIVVAVTTGLVTARHYLRRRRSGPSDSEDPGPGELARVGPEPDREPANGDGEHQ